ncbi:MAG: tetratricopeptide repeat protein [Candidatus Melainabacteria bacterium]|jgi:TolA-binding protein|nr:tetratricopeptide repeat protein [Candidatus Melainabacteria bacterium]
MQKRHLINAIAACLVAVLPAMSAPANMYNQAVADYNAGRYGQAAAAFESLKTSYPNNALTHYYLALCRQALGHLDKAKQEYQWVSQYGDASLKGLAAQGLSRMSGARSSVSNGKVKKILEFYASW